MQFGASSDNEKLVNDLVDEVEEWVKRNNIYKNQKLKFDILLHFIETGSQSWDDIILDAEMKAQIFENTLGFIDHFDTWRRYGIPVKRGIVFSDDPGTGKTILCKSMIEQAENVTCIIIDSYVLTEPKVIVDLFNIAQDLSPTIVFIEDIQVIGIDRDGFGISQPALLTLLNVMDGLSETKRFITIATTNDVQELDKALKERSTRFDRVFMFTHPSYEHRVQILESQAGTIPLSDAIIEYIARKTEGFTPAQLKEVVNGMVISQVCSSGSVKAFSEEDVDKVISQMEIKKKNKVGFR